jgi:hypothetical protein
VPSRSVLPARVARLSRWGEVVSGGWTAITLVRILDRDGVVFAACRHAVLNGARYWVTEVTQPASTLPPLHFQLFVSDDGVALIACLGVDQTWNPNRHLA